MSFFLDLDHYRESYITIETTRQMKTRLSFRFSVSTEEMADPELQVAALNGDMLCGCVLGKPITARLQSCERVQVMGHPGEVWHLSGEGFFQQE